MPSAGELLRCERLKRNRSLSEIASETCICTRYLEAIEADNPKTLPGDFFYRSFIRQYARALCLDEPITREILDAVGPPVEIDPFPVFNIPQQIAEVEQSAKPLARIPTRVAAMLLFVVMVGCSGLFALWNRAQEAADPAMHFDSSTTVQSTDGAQPVSGLIPAAPQTTASSPDEKQPVRRESGPMDVKLAATEKTWVSLSSDGKTVYSGVLDPSESKQFAIAEQHARLLTGNAAGLDVRVNGRAVGPLGTRGQVRLVLLGQHDFQILSPRKM